MISFKSVSSAGPAGDNTISSSIPFNKAVTGPQMAVTAPNLVEDDGSQEDSACSCSYESLTGDSIMSTQSSSSGYHSCAHRMTVTNNNHNSSMKRSLGAKSSYALTSLLQQQNDSSHSSMSSSNNSNSLAAAIVAEAKAIKPVCPKEFGQSLQRAIASSPPGGELNLHDNRNVRQALESPLRQARTARDSSRRAAALWEGSARSTSTDPTGIPAPLPLSSWVGLPYASLRDERPFLYDHMHTHPLSELLAQALSLPQGSDLSQLHQGWNPSKEAALDHQRRLFAPLRTNRKRRLAFQAAYESFVTSCCLPLLHAAALRGNVFNSSCNRQHHVTDPVLYRYQVFPTINVVYPNDLEACQPPSCDLSQGKSVGWLHFHVPLTASAGTSALFCERYPGREDWHALRCTQVGLGYCWDGARCLSFVPLNTTGATRVSLDFRILLVRASTAQTRSLSQLAQQPEGAIDDDTLCRPHHLQDALTRIGGFYKETTLEGAGRSSGGRLVEPDARCGFPFA